MNALSRWAVAALLAMPSAVAAQEAVPTCELHVWPTEIYLGINMGLLSGLGPIGAVADVEAHKDRVATVKDLMKSWLGPDIQMEELAKADYKAKLGLAGHQVIMHPSLPTPEEAKTDPAIAEQRKATAAKIKAGQRLSDSKAACYAELVVDYIFYFKAMMHGSNLFANWIFRDFGPTGTKVVRMGNGQVKNPLEQFPSKTPDLIPAAKAELRDAFARDFAEYVAKKVK